MRKFYPGSVRVKDLLRSFTLILLCFVSLAVKAATITATASGGHWGVGSTWMGGVVPGSGDIAVIPAGSTVIFSESDGTAGSLGQINFNNSGTIQVYGIFNLQTASDDPVFQHAVTIDVFSGGQMQDNTAFGEMYLPEVSHLYVYAGGVYNSSFNTNFIDGSVIPVSNAHEYFLILPSPPNLAGPFTIDFTSAAVNYSPATNPPSASTPPSVVTGAALSVTVNSATVAGTVNDNGAATSVSIVYGTDPTLTVSTPATPSPATVGVGAGNTAVGASLTGLSATTKYYYQIRGNSASGSGSGAIQSFATLSAVYTVGYPSGNHTYVAGDDLLFLVQWTGNVKLTSNTAGGTPFITLTVGSRSVHATLTSVDGSMPIAYFKYTIQPGDYAPSGVTLGNPITLNGGTIVDFYSHAVPTDISAPVVSSSPQPGVVVLAPQLPQVSGETATNINANRVTLGATVNDELSNTAVTFRYGTDAGLAGATTITATPTSVGVAVGNTAVTANLTGLSSSTHYYYQVVAINGVGTTSGTIQDFFTPDIAPVVTTTSGTTTYSAVGAGSGTVVVDPGVTVSDGDNTTLPSATVSITAGLNSGDILTFTNSGGIVGSYDVVHGVLTLTASFAATLAQWNTALQSVIFDNVSPGAAVGNRTISFIVNDGTLNSAAATRTVDVEQGLAYTGGVSQSVSFCENSPAQSINDLLAVSDLATGQTLTYSIVLAPGGGTLGGFTPGIFSSNGGTLIPTGLTYTPTAGFSGTDMFSIQVSNGTQTAMTVINVTVNAQPSVNPVTGSGPVCAGSTITLSSGPASGVWSSDNTSVATVDASGLVTGHTQGTANITYTITNGSGCSNSASAPVVVNPVPATPGTMTGSAAVQNTQTGVTYSVTNDPNITYSWSYIPAAGVTIHGTGNAVTLDFGTTAASGTLSVTPFSVCGIAGTPSALAITVSAPTITLSPVSVAMATVGVGYNTSITASGGTSPYTFAVTSGTLPDGLTLDGDGVLSGIPTAGGAFPITIKATDGSAGHYTGSQVYTLTVNAPTIAIVQTTLPVPSIGTMYSESITASGGTSPYSFAVTSGTLPVGLTLAGDGVLSGTPILAGDFSFTVTATDASTGAGPYTGSASYTVHIAPVTLTITATDESMTYGGVVPRLSITYNGFVNGDDASSLTVAPTLTTTATPASAAGPYSITASGAISGKYTFVYVPGVLTVNPASVSVTAKAQTKVYGNPDPNLAYTFTGLVNGDGAGVFTGGLSRDPGENVGTYPITQGTLSAGGNYTLQFTGSLLTITSASQQISWTQQLLSGCDDMKQLQLTGNSSSGLPLIYTSSDANVATVSGDILTLVGPGSATITATQPGDDNHLAAAPLDNTVVNQSSSLVRQHWEDALFFDNTGNNYVQWQWYKNGSAVSGANSPYYSETPSLSGQYYVIATDKDGHQVQTCPLNVTGNGAVTGGIKVSPNPASAGQAVSVTCNYTATALQGARLQVLNISGIVVQTLTNVQPGMQVNMPTTRGIYVLSLVLSNGQKASVNVLVN